MSKEAFCLILDLRLDRETLEQAVKAILFPRLLNAKKTDWFTMVLLGTDLTDHHLDADEFPHLTSIHNPDRSASFSQWLKVKEMPGSTQIGDLVDGVIVGADLIIEHTKGKVFDRQIVLITEDGSNVKWSDEGDLEQVYGTLREHDISLKIYARSTFKLLHCQSLPLSLLKPSPRSVRRVAQFKGDLWIGSQLSIPVQMHAVCQPGKLPAPSRSWHGQALEMSYTGQSEERVKAYRYGKDWIPFSKLDEQQLALPVSKGIFLLGFSAAPLPIEWWMGPASLLTGQDDSAQSLIAGLCQCLQQREQVAIARLVRQEAVAPLLVALMPHATQGLLVIGMPWSEDVRAFAFPSLERGLTALLPSDTQMDAMRSFVQQVRNASSADLPVDNPAYSRLVERIAARCQDPHAPITPSPTLHAAPHPTHLIAEAFPMRPAARWSYAPVQSRQWDTVAETAAVAEKNVPPPASPTRRQIRPDSVMEDFNAMCTNRHYDLVKPAMLQLMTIIADISHTQPTIALEFLRQLRAVALREGEESLYNRFMTDLNELRLSGSDQFPSELWNLMDDELKETIK